MGFSSAPPLLTVFCGKGGVGKTTLGLAYGLWHAGRGKRVVVVTSHPLSELAVSISLNGLREQQPTAAANLFVVHIDPREILGNKVMQQIPSEFLARKVISSRLYQNLVEVAPGLKEIAFLARLKQLAERRTRTGEGEAFDLLVWDSPATGHFLQTLKASRSFDTYLSGPFAVLGKELLAFLSDPSSIRFVPVTLLEEMAIDETLELCEELDNTLHVPPASLICNLASPLAGATDEVFREISDKLDAAASGAESLKFILARQSIERDLYKRILLAARVEPQIIQRVPRWDSDLELLLALGNPIAHALMEESS